MSDILTFNQSVFDTKTIERSISKRAKKAQSKELYTPVDSDVITYDEGYDVDGGGTFKIRLSVAGGLAGIGSGILTQLICGYISGKYHV